MFVEGRGSKIIRRAPTTNRKRKSPLGPVMTRPANALSLAGAGWAALDDPTRTAWNTQASQISFPNRLGEHRPLNGYLLYMKVNTQRALRRLTIMTAGPGTVRPQGIASLSITASVANGLDVTLDSPIAPSGRTILTYGSIHWGSTAPKFFRDYRYLGHLSFSKTVTLDITAVWEPRFGPLRLNQHIALRLISWLSTSWPGAPTVGTATVVA